MDLQQRENKRWLIADRGDGPAVGGVTIRAGVLDESPNTLGIHHVAAWLLRIGTNSPVEAEMETISSAFGSGSLRTTFTFWGNEQGVASRIDTLIDAVINPPLELLADAIERTKIENPFLNTATGILLSNRFGPKGPGMAGLRPFYLDNVDPDEVVRYIRTYFCAESAMFWANSEFIAASVTKSLPLGRVMPVSPAPVATSPSIYLTDVRERVTFTGIVDAGPPGRVAAEVIGTRIHRRVAELQALASQVSFAMCPLDANHSMAMVEVLAGKGLEGDVVDAISQTLDDIKERGPLAEEVVRERELLADNLRNQPVTDTLDIAAGEILLSGTSQWLHEVEAMNGDIGADVAANIHAACQSAQIVVDRTQAAHEFTYRVHRPEPFVPKGYSKHYTDLLDRTSWYRLDGPYLSRMKRTSILSYRAQPEWITDLRHVGAVVTWTNGSSAYLDDFGESTALYWARIKSADKLRAKLEPHIVNSIQISAHSDEDLVGLSNKVRKSRRSWAAWLVFRVALVALIVSGAIGNMIDSKPTKTATPVNNGTIAPRVALTRSLGSLGALPNGATYQVFSFDADDGTHPTSSTVRATADVQVCGGAVDSSGVFNQFATSERNLVRLFDFKIVLEDNTVVTARDDPSLQPAFPVTNLATGDCRRGLVAFSRPMNHQVKAVSFQNEVGDSITWLVTG